MYALVITIILSNGIILQDIPETYPTKEACKKEEIYQNIKNQRGKGGTISFKCEAIPTTANRK